MIRHRMEEKGKNDERIVRMYGLNYDQEKIILTYLRDNKIMYECDTEVEHNGNTYTSIEIGFEHDKDYYFFLAFIGEQKFDGE